MSDPKVKPARQSSRAPHHESLANRFWLDCLGTLTVFFLYAGEKVPGVNEPHYWTKATHFWDSQFAKGDLFLESGDAHWLFFATFGLLTRFLPIFYVVWTVRFLMWSAMAAGWAWMIRNALRSDSHSGQQVRQNVVIPLAGTFTAILWLAGMHWGHLAGEWVVGGAEAKGIAYACLFGGIGFLLQKRPTLAWSLMGVGAAFHVVTGAWVILCSMIAVVWIRDRSQPIQSEIGKHLTGLILGGLISLFGVIPALIIDWGVPDEIVSQAAIKQVYGRLSHHLAPTMMSTLRWQCFIAQLVIAFVGYWALRGCKPTPAPNQDTEFATDSTVVTTSTSDKFQVLPDYLPYGIRFLLANTLAALACLIVGYVIDKSLGVTSQATAAKILKYYWFRWNDVALPLSVATCLVAIAYERLIFVESKRAGQVISFAIASSVSILFLMSRYNEIARETIPFGDKAKLIDKKDSEIDQRRHYQDWLNVCEWIRENTDKDGTWLTPRNQQSFKWHTHRAEFANWKDMPQDARSIVEWTRRLDAAYQFDGEKILQPWSTQDLSRLHRDFGIRYVLIDRRVQGQTPPALPILYPPFDAMNSTFSVFAFPTERLPLSSVSSMQPKDSSSQSVEAIGAESQSSVNAAK